MQFQRKAIMNYSYNMGDVIGKGFSSVVYRGVNDSTQETVAIKVIQRQFCDQLPAIQNEISILSKVDGPNILKLYDHFTTQNNIYIITEYCKQGDLRANLNQGVASEEVGIKIIAQLINALDSLHQQNILHRDIKPHNLLVNDGVIKLADFGFAKSLHQLQQNEMNVGTPLYMSPETLTRNQYLINSDVWSLGILFYELLYGMAPWNVQSEQELLHHMFNSSIRFPDQPSVSDQIKSVILSCLMIEPRARTTIQELKQHPLFKRKRIRTCKENTRTSTEDGDNIKQQAYEILRKYQKVRLNESITKQSNLCEEVLMSQMCYCNFIYHLIPKIEGIRFETPFLTQKVKYILSKHLQSLITSLEKQSQENTFNLRDWDKFTQSATYKIFYEQFNSKQEQFNKEIYEIINLVRQNDFHQEMVRNDRDFCQQAYKLDYKVMLKVLQIAIVEYNHMLMQMVPHRDCSNIQNDLNTLANLLKYYKLVEVFKCGDQFNEIHFSQKSEGLYPIKEITYQYRNYIELRQQIKQIMKN